MLVAEDATVPAAVAAALPDLTRAVDLLVAALRAGRAVRVAGAGTSGRLAALDADELGPTYGLEPGRWTAHVAHYDGTVDAEDDTAAGAAVGAALRPGDVLVGVTASGRTPYAVSALRAARDRGAGTVLLSGNPTAAAGSEVDVHVAVRTGPEAVTGSTRLKAGTAQKLAPERVVHSHHGPLWTDLVEPHGRRGGDQLEAARPHRRRAGRRDRRGPAGVRRGGGGGRRGRKSGASHPPQWIVHSCCTECPRRHRWSPSGGAAGADRDHSCSERVMSRHATRHSGSADLDSVRTGRSLHAAYRPSVAHPREAPEVTV